MDFAEKNGIKSGDDVENECLHRDHVEELKRKAELLRLQEQRAMAEDRFESQHEETGRGEEYKNGSMNSGSSGGGEGEGGNSVDEAHYSGSTNSNSNEFNDMNDEDSEGGAYDMDDYSNNDNEGGGGGENASSQQHEQQHQQSEQVCFIYLLCMWGSADRGSFTWNVHTNWTQFVENANGPNFLWTDPRIITANLSYISSLMNYY